MTLPLFHDIPKERLQRAYAALPKQTRQELRRLAIFTCIEVLTMSDDKLERSEALGLIELLKPELKVPAFGGYLLRCWDYEVWRDE